MITGNYDEKHSPEARNARPFFNLFPTPRAGHAAAGGHVTEPRKFVTIGGVDRREFLARSGGLGLGGVARSRAIRADQSRRRSCSGTRSGRM